MKGEEVRYGRGIGIVNAQPQRRDASNNSSVVQVVTAYQNHCQEHGDTFDKYVDCKDTDQ